jgi:hypothetical protein
MLNTTDIIALIDHPSIPTANPTAAFVLLGVPVPDVPAAIADPLGPFVLVMPLIVSIAISLMLSIPCMADPVSTAAACAVSGVSALGVIEPETYMAIIVEWGIANHPGGASCVAGS